MCELGADGAGSSESKWIQWWVVSASEAFTAGLNPRREVALLAVSYFRVFIQLDFS